ncbi:MAG: LysE family transporter, partial [Gammaproteobacteria bacterium]|nr:LysE family transporter [Gammaproteobacteria bacterium]MCY4296667.1 LysE family transporter [Gammaproteobacteria bacterium]
MEQFLTIAVAHLFAVASPGPDFAVVLRQSVNGGTRAGLWTSAGVGTGIFLHIAYCLLGVALLLSRVDWLFTLVKWLAAAYLAWLGLQSLFNAWRG